VNHLPVIMDESQHSVIKAVGSHLADPDSTFTKQSTSHRSSRKGHLARMCFNVSRGPDGGKKVKVVDLYSGSTRISVSKARR